MLLALDHWLGPRREVVLAGSLQSERGRALRRVVDRAFLPRTVIAHVSAELPASLAPELAAGKVPVGDAAVYVCEDFACEAPCTDPEVLRQTLTKSVA